MGLCDIVIMLSFVIEQLINDHSLIKVEISDYIMHASAYIMIVYSQKSQLQLYLRTRLQRRQCLLF